MLLVILIYAFMLLTFELKMLTFKMGLIRTFKFILKFCYFLIVLFFPDLFPRAFINHIIYLKKIRIYVYRLLL